MNVLVWRKMYDKLQIVLKRAEIREFKMLAISLLNSLRTSQGQSCCPSSLAVSATSLVKPVSRSSQSCAAILFSFSIGERFWRFPLPAFVAFSYRYC